MSPHMAPFWQGNWARSPQQQSGLQQISQSVPPPEKPSPHTARKKIKTQKLKKKFKKGTENTHQVTKYSCKDENQERRNNPSQIKKKEQERRTRNKNERRNNPSQNKKKEQERRTRKKPGKKHRTEANKRSSRKKHNTITKSLSQTKNLSAERKRPLIHKSYSKEGTIHTTIQ